MISTLRSGLLRRVQREPEEHEPSYFRDEIFRRRRGGHAPTHRLPTGQQRQFGGSLVRRLHRSRNGRGQRRRSIRRLPPILHVGKLIAKRGDLFGGKLARKRGHKRMPHPSTRSVSKHEHPPCVRRPNQDGRNLACAADRETGIEFFSHFAEIIAEAPSGKSKASNVRAMLILRPWSLTMVKIGDMLLQLHDLCLWKRSQFRSSKRSVWRYWSAFAVRTSPFALLDSESQLPRLCRLLSKTVYPAAWAHCPT